MPPNGTALGSRPKQHESCPGGRSRGGVGAERAPILCMARVPADTRGTPQGGLRHLNSATSPGSANPYLTVQPPKRPDCCLYPQTAAAPALLHPSGAGWADIGAKGPGNRDLSWHWLGGLARGCPPAQHKCQWACRCLLGTVLPGHCRQTAPRTRELRFESARLCAAGCV